MRPILPLSKNSLRMLLLAGFVLALMVVLGRIQYVKQKSEKAYNIGVILSPSELPPGQMTMLKELVSMKLAEINEQGGLNGIPLTVKYIDDQNNDSILYKLVQQTSQDPNLVAYVGARGVSRAKTIAPLLSQKRIPFIGLYVFTSLFEKFPTMYTGSMGVKEARPVFTELLRQKATRFGFISEKNNPVSDALEKALQLILAENPEIKVPIRRAFPRGHIFDASDKQLIDSLKTQTDFLILLGNLPSYNSFLDYAHIQNLQIPVYIAAPDMPLIVAAIDAEKPGYKAAELYYFNTYGIPGAQNNRLLEQLNKLHKNKPINDDIIAQLSVSGRIADEIGLIHEAARTKLVPGNMPVREKINAGLKQYINGKQIYRGWLTDWYFTPEHAISGETLIAWKPRGKKGSVLAPYQFMYADSGLQKRQVLYTNLNLVEINQVDVDQGTFYATFYFEINSADNLTLKQIDFANAARNEINHEALIEAKLIRSKKDTSGYKFYNNLYKISGKFYFEPDLRNYPLDQQSFPISLQASNPGTVFMVQPTRKELRDSLFESEGWVYRNQYMGYDQDIITTAQNFYGKRKNIPYYKFSYVYVMKRAHIDFFLKTLVPLMTIVIITYFSVYIPPREFEALAAVQVTGLLSSIALYFSTYKPAMQYATISDKIFIFVYVMITTLIGTSILLYVLHHRNTTFTRMMMVYQRFLFPLIVLGFTIYIRWF